MPFLQAQGKCLHLQGSFLKSQFHNSFSHFCFSFLIFFLYDNTFYLSSSFPNFTALLQEAAIPFQLGNEMPQYFHLLNTVLFQSFSSFLHLIRYCSFLSKFFFFFCLHISLLNINISPAHKLLIFTSGLIFQFSYNVLFLHLPSRDCIHLCSRLFASFPNSATNSICLLLSPTAINKQ